MATEAKTATQAEVKVSAKVVAAIKAQIEAQTIATSRKVQTAQTLVSEAKRMGLDKTGARSMLVKAWREAKGFASKDETAIAVFDLNARPDVSKVMALAFPEGVAATELAKAIKHNETNVSKASRIGENRLLEIARGNQTFDDAKNGKPVLRVAKDAPDSKLPAADRFGNAIAALRKQYCEAQGDAKPLITLAKALEIATQQLSGQTATTVVAAK